MPAFDRLSPSFIKHFLSRIKHPKNFTHPNVAENDGILSVLKPFDKEVDIKRDVDVVLRHPDFYWKQVAEYGFEIAPVPIRFGKGFTSDISHELDKLKPKKILIITDKNVEKTRAYTELALSMIPKTHLSYDLYNDVPNEITEKSLHKAIKKARSEKYDCFVAVGGSNVVDTARLVDLFASNPQLDFDGLMKHPHTRYLDSTNANYPLISIPTTISLASEAIGSLRFRIEGKNSLESVEANAIKPILILADPLNVMSMPRHVTIYGALEVLIQALEAFTLKEHVPHISNMPYVSNSSLQTVFRTSNNVSDIWAQETLEIMQKYLREGISDPDNYEARSQLLLASVFSSIGFRNPITRFCHTLSYPIRALGKHYIDKEYQKNEPFVPRGLAVAMVAPVAFKFSTYADRDRHLEAARTLGSTATWSSTHQQIGCALSDILCGYYKDFGLPDGLSGLGFKWEDMSKLAEIGAECLTPSDPSSKAHDQEIFQEIYEAMWKIY